VNAQGLFCDENFQLVEFPQKRVFKRGDESGASLTAEVQNGHDDNEIEVEAGVALPDALQGELPLLRSQTTEPREQALLHGVEEFIGERPAVVIRQRQIPIVTAGRSSVPSIFD
jgi:hypothetical protein